jgi:Tfp pilus assembly protein PilF
LVGCASKGTPGAQDPERQSMAAYDVGVDALHKGNYRMALAEAKKSIDLDDSNADAQLLASTIYVAMCTYSPDECRLHEAEKHARQALKLRADFRAARNTLGSVLVNEKKYDEAITVLKPLTEDILYATPEVAWGNLGWAHLERGDLALAVDALRRAVALEPRFCWGNAKLALALEKKGDLKAAEQAVTSAIDTDLPQCKNFADAYEIRARILNTLGQSDGARADLELCSKVGAGTPVGRRCTASLQTP